VRGFGGGGGGGLGGGGVACGLIWPNLCFLSYNFKDILLGGHDRTLFV